MSIPFLLPRAYEDLSQAERVAAMSEQARAEFWGATPDKEIQGLLADWHFWARPKQLPPPGGWLTWNVRAGRGFGKTATGSGWVHRRAMEQPERWIAIIGKTPADVRDYQIEGPGGILRSAPEDEAPQYEPSKRRLTWRNGSWATLYSSEEPDQLRGFSGDTAWFDEFAKYRNPRECWDNLQFGMREISDDHPRTLVTSTPRPLPLLEEIESNPDTVTVVGSSYENKSNLSPIWFAKTVAAYEGTRLGRQEIHAEILADVEGRVYSNFSRDPFPDGNVDAAVVDTGGELLVGQDFNVNPMCSVLGVRVADELHLFDEIRLMTSNTDATAAAIRERYPERYVVVCPDPSGKSRHTNAPIGQTDHTILERYGFEVRAPRQAPPVVDRVNNTQAMFHQVDPEAGTSRQRIRIHPRCEHLIRALSGLQYKEGTSQRDKGSGFDHPCDALDYLVWQEFNVLVEAGAVFTTYEI